MFDSAKAKTAPDPEVQGRALDRLFKEYSAAMGRERKIVALLTEHLVDREAHTATCPHWGGCRLCGPIAAVLMMLNAFFIAPEPRHLQERA